MFLYILFILFKLTTALPIHPVFIYVYANNHRNTCSNVGIPYNITTQTCDVDNNCTNITSTSVYHNNCDEFPLALIIVFSVLGFICLCGVFSIIISKRMKKEDRFEDRFEDVVEKHIDYLAKGTGGYATSSMV